MGGTYAELNLRREEVDALLSEERALNEGGSNDTLLAVQSTEESIGELSTGVSHREGSASSTVLGLHDLITTKLNAMDQLVIDFTSDTLALVSLRE